MNNEITEMEKRVYQLNIEISDLDKLATDAYKIRDFKTEDEYQEKINQKVDEKKKLTGKLAEYYLKDKERSNEILEKFANSEIFMGIIGKIAQVSQPFVREISVHRAGDGTKYAYVKLDATDGYTDKVQQTKIYWSKHTVQEIIEGLTRVFKEL